jgi:hypothetical protein
MDGPFGGTRGVHSDTEDSVAGQVPLHEVGEGLSINVGMFGKSTIRIPGENSYIVIHERKTSRGAAQKTPVLAPGAGDSLSISTVAQTRWAYPDHNASERPRSPRELDAQSWADVGTRKPHDSAARRKTGRIILRLNVTSAMTTTRGLRGSCDFLFDSFV